MCKRGGCTQDMLCFSVYQFRWLRMVAQSNDHEQYPKYLSLLANPEHILGYDWL